MENSTYCKELEDAAKKCLDKLFSKNILPSSQKFNIYKVLEARKDENYIHHFPHAIFWKLTSDCNLRCKHCFYAKSEENYNSKNDFSGNELLKLAEFFIEELNAISFALTGGEPFLQKDIFKIIEYLKSKNAIIQIQTNATLINDEIAKKLGKLLNPKFDSIQVSLDGVTEKTHDIIRGLGSFKKTVEGIRRLTNNNINVSISTTLTSQNIREIPDIYSLGKDLKVKRISLCRFKICSEEQSYLKPNSDEVFLYVAKLLDNIEGDNSINVKLKFLKVFDFLNYDFGTKLLDKYMESNEVSQVNNLMCHRHEKVNVCADGKIYLCADTESEELCLGNLKEKSFYEIWKNRFDNVFFQERILENSVCQKCKYVSLCSAGCPAKAYCSYGNINTPDSECSYGKILVEENKEKGKIYVR